MPIWNHVDGFGQRLILKCPFSQVRTCWLAKTEVKKNNSKKNTKSNVAILGVSHVFISLTLSDSLKNWVKKGWYLFFAQESPWRCAPRTKLWNLLGHGGSFGNTRHRAPQGFINHLLKQLMEVYMGIWHTHLYGKRTILYCDWNKYGTHHILPVEPHEAVPEVSKKYSIYKSKQTCAYRMVCDNRFPVSRLIETFVWWLEQVGICLLCRSTQLHATASCRSQFATTCDSSYVLQSSTPYWKSTTPVLLCTTKY